MIKWTKIDDNNKPVFGKQYLFCREKKGWYMPEKVWYGTLNEIEITEDGEEYIYKVSEVRIWEQVHYGYERNITHFIEIADIPNVC